MHFHDISRDIRAGAPDWATNAAFAEAQSGRQACAAPGSIGPEVTRGCSPLGAVDSVLADERVSLLPYIGAARVIDARGVEGVVRPGDAAAHLACAPGRILFRTQTTSADAAREPHFASLHPETVELLAAHGVLLVGTDAPSIDPDDSATMDAQRAARRANIRILEGLLLRGVPPGDYELIALPLSRHDPAAWPVRAILRDLT